MHNDFKHLLKDDINFKEILQWLKAEKQIVIKGLGGTFGSEHLQRLSGSLNTMNHLINEIEKEKPKR